MKPYTAQALNCSCTVLCLSCDAHDSVSKRATFMTSVIHFNVGVLAMIQEYYSIYFINHQRIKLFATLFERTHGDPNGQCIVK